MKDDAEIQRIRLKRATRNLLELASFTEQTNVSASSARAVKPLASTGLVAKANLPDTPAINDENPVVELEKQGKTAKPRAAVVAWDLSHNPAGRALVLYRLLEEDYEVDLVGPVWSRFGKGLWEPLRGQGLNVRQFSCKELMDFVPKAEFVANAKTYDLVYVCKPRMPSMFLGKLISLNSECPMIVDVDDFELSFFKNEEYANYPEMVADAKSALVEPYEELATRYCQTLIEHADEVTVSNVALKQRFGGHIVRHAREETEFKYSDELRASGRQRLNVADDAYLLLFVGTPRPHKGVLEVARAVFEINDPNIVFHVVGTITDRRFRNVLREYDCEQIVYHDNCDFSELPEILAAADLVPLIQDSQHAISQYQIPAKVSDATAMGIPVLSSRTPPLEDLIVTGCVIETSDRGLKADILDCVESRESVVRSTIRGSFTGELGTQVNRSRLKLVIDDLEDHGPDTHSPLIDMVNLVRETYALQRGEEICREAVVQKDIARTTANIHNPSTQDNVRSLFSANKEFLNHQVVYAKGKGPSILNRLTGRFKGSGHGDSVAAQDCQYDIAFFWKQNDSRIYGRRSDMVAKYLAQSGRVRSLVHFDAPIDSKTIQQRMTEAEKNDVEGYLSQQQLLIRNLYDRQLGMFDSDNRLDRTFIKSADKDARFQPGTSNPKEKSYSEYVKQVLEDHGMKPETTIAWFCPVVWEATTLVDKIDFAAVVSDLIDDQRAWAFRNETYSLKLEESYHDLLSKSDLVFANCESLATAFVDQVEKIHVVPNGAECLTDVSLPQGSRFSFSTKPIIGYVGNLRDRIDWMLLHKVVAELPEFDFVFMGPSSDSENALALAKHDNVSMLGVVPYDEMVAYLGEIDVAIVPHLNNHLTAKMNPLKVYNYFAAGLPIVSTDVANLGEFGSRLTRADTPEDFVAALRAAVANPVDTRSKDWIESMQNISWVDRIDSIMQAMDSTFGESYSTKCAAISNSEDKLPGYLSRA